MVNLSNIVDMSGLDQNMAGNRFSTVQGQIGPRVIDVNGQTPIVVSGTSATLTASNLMTGLIISTNAGATTLNLDTAANIFAACNAIGGGAAVGDTIWFTVSSHGAGGATIAVGTGGTLTNGTSGTVATGTQRLFHLQLTSATTYTVNG